MRQGDAVFSVKLQTVLVTEAQARKGLLAMDTLSSGVWTETLNKEKK